MPSLNEVIDPNNHEKELPHSHREAMLDLILTWGSLDGALGMLLSSFSKEPLSEVAVSYGRSRGSTKIHQMIKSLPDDEKFKPVRKVLKTWKTDYERYSIPRNRIAHAHCGGVLKTDPNYLIFAVFEKEGDGKIAVEAIPVDEIVAATEWGKKFEKTCLALFDRHGPKK